MSSSSTSKSSLLDEIHDAKPAAKSVATASSSSRRNMTLSIGMVVVAVGVLVYVVFSTMQSIANDPRRAAAYTRVMDLETGEYIEKFPFTGERLVFPAKNPKTGRNSLVPVELCYWTKDGKAKMEPTPVILNQWLNKSGPTTCPDCGRPVTKGNRMPPDDLMQAAWDASQKK